MKTILFFLMTFAVVQSPFTNAQSPQTAPQPIRWGVQGIYGLHQHSANFTALPGVPNSSPGFSGDIGTGFGGGILMEIPIISSVPDLFLGLRASYALHNARFVTNEEATISVDGSPIPAIFRHSLAFALPLIAVDMLPAWRFPDALNGLHIMAGLRGGFWVAPKFSQTEELIEGTGKAQFSSGGTQRNVRTNEDLPSAAPVQLAALLGIGYDFALTDTKNILLTPEVQYGLHLTQFVSGLSWQANTLRLNLAIKYNPAAKAPEAAQKLQAQTITQTQINAVTAPNESLNAKPKTLTASVKAYSVDADGNEHELIILKTEEFISRQLYPLLNYVFFDQNSDVIPARYERITTARTRTYTEKSLSGRTTLDIYYDVLNVIGKRLVDNPTATIRLVGCLGEVGFGPQSEENDPYLALRRAESVKQYLTGTWGIAGNRIRTEGRALPEKPSNSKNATIGAEENRRVEIYSDSWAIVQPVVIADTLRETDAPVVKFQMSAESDESLTKWTLRALQGNKKLKEYSTLGAPDPQYQWRPSRERSTIPTTEEPLRYELEVVNAADKDFTAQNTIAVEQITIQRKRQNRIADKEVDVYRLIGFPFEQAAVEGVNLRTINEFVKPNLKPESVVTIIGYTDASGDAASNQRLSDSRAAAVGKELAMGFIKTRGVGSRTALYTNLAPEGRLYSRTVEVRVETPVR
ncbi:MAG: OmpA family protein [Candidatus Kapabacteria bacterium]|jgi:outer membrane protein OmpA-like peptidoglycan-associated protein|nr:OmpA family protein [Candidatus Kapabacteria bacterium]